jgi:hypothetical protein
MHIYVVWMENDLERIFPSGKTGKNKPLTVLWQGEGTTALTIPDRYGMGEPVPLS